MFRVTTEPLDVQQINRQVKTPSDGAVVTFDGIVRDNFDGRQVRHLEYEAYASMAEKKMAEIADEVRDKFAGGRRRHGASGRAAGDRRKQHPHCGGGAPPPTRL